MKFQILFRLSKPNKQVFSENSFKLKTINMVVIRIKRICMGNHFQKMYVQQIYLL